MPDYSIVQALCQILGITVIELLNGEENNQNDEVVIDLLWLKEKAKKFKWVIAGLLCMNIAELIRNYLPADQNLPAFFLGLIDGSLAGFMIVGVCLFVYGIASYFRKVR